MKLSREIKTALIVIFGIILFIFGFNYLKGNNLLKSTRTFYAEYENVDGLTPSVPVTINGFVVGHVKSVGFKDESGIILVSMELDNDFKFSKNSIAQLYDVGLIGGKAISIIPIIDGSAIAKDGDMLQASKKMGVIELVDDKITPLKNKVETALVSLDELLSNINSILDEKTKTNLRNAIGGLNSTITSLNNTSKSLNTFISKADSELGGTFKNLNDTSTHLAQITESFSKADIEKITTKLENSLSNFNAILDGIANGKGSLGKLANDDALYTNLEGATKQLEELLQDFKLNPKRYVHFSIFGKKAKIYDAEGNQIEEAKDE